MTTASIASHRFVLTLWAVACCLACMGAARPPHPFTVQPSPTGDTTEWFQTITFGADLDTRVWFYVDNDNSGKLTGRISFLDENGIGRETLATLEGKVSRAGKFSAKVTSFDARIAPLGKKIKVSGQWERLSTTQIQVRMADKRMEFFSIDTFFYLNT